MNDITTGLKCITHRKPIPCWTVLSPMHKWNPRFHRWVQRVDSLTPRLTGNKFFPGQSRFFWACHLCCQLSTVSNLTRFIKRLSNSVSQHWVSWSVAAALIVLLRVPGARGRSGRRQPMYRAVSHVTRLVKKLLHILKNIFLPKRRKCYLLFTHAQLFLVHFHKLNRHEIMYSVENSCCHTMLSLIISDTRGSPSPQVTLLVVHHKIIHAKGQSS